MKSSASEPGLKFLFVTMALKKSTEGKIIETLRIETPERFSGSVSFYFERILMFPSKTLFTRVQENF